MSWICNDDWRVSNRVGMIKWLIVECGDVMTGCSRTGCHNWALQQSWRDKDWILEIGVGTGSNCQGTTFSFTDLHWITNHLCDHLHDPTLWFELQHHQSLGSWPWYSGKLVAKDGRIVCSLVIQCCAILHVYIGDLTDDGSLDFSLGYLHHQVRSLS